MGQDWPGNARALMSEAMRFAMGMNLPAAAREQTLAERMAAVERGFLCEALERAQGNATEAAQGLGLPRKTFYDKLARHGIRPEAFREI
jgi:two-component system C4-dicarboxylate transport response regulator DctD